MRDFNWTDTCGVDIIDGEDDITSWPPRS